MPILRCYSHGNVKSPNGCHVFVNVIVEEFNRKLVMMVWVESLSSPSPLYLQ